MVRLTSGSDPVRGPVAILALTLALMLALMESAACRAGEGRAESVAIAPPATAAAIDETNPVGSPPPAVPDTAGAPERSPRPHVRRAPGRGVDETVRLLTRGLNLDASQQVRLRQILWDEQMQARDLRQNPGAGVDWVSATATIVDQTRTRIRAMLNDEQKQKYASDVPRDLTAPAQADLQHWLALQDSRRLQADGATK